MTGPPGAGPPRSAGPPPGGARPRGGTSLRTGAWLRAAGSPRGRGALRRIGPLLAVGALLGAAAVAAALATPQITSVPVPQLIQSGHPPPANTPAGAVSQPPGAGRMQPDTQLPGWVGVLVTVLCIGIVGAIVAVIIWMVFRDSLVNRKGRLVPEEEQAPDPVVSRDQVLAAVDAGLSGLADDETDPRRAVIACWVRLEEAAASAGTPRHPGDSPTDLVLRLLAAHQVSAPVLYPLAEVYRLARYATHTVDAGMRDRARTALRQLRAELAREPVMGTNR
jgi:hypothetical protein